MNTATQSPPDPTTVADYLLARLAQAGLISVFGVPGDHNLGLLDAVADRPGLNWIGMATEQGAGYAADSYARLRGIGALVTTFGVGELSAMNAIAGAYAECVPVVHIVGTPALTARTPGATLHHNLPGSDYGHFVRMAAEVTVAQADLRPDTAPAEIDRVLSTALRTSRPVYIAIPADVASAEAPQPAGRLRRSGQDPDPAVLAAFTGRVRRMLDRARPAEPPDRPPGRPVRGHRAGPGPWGRREPSGGGAVHGQGRLPRIRPAVRRPVQRTRLGQARPGGGGGRRCPDHRRGHGRRHRARRLARAAHWRPRRPGTKRGEH